MEEQVDRAQDGELCKAFPATAIVNFHKNGLLNKSQLNPYTEDIMGAVKVLLQELGEDVTRDGLLKTPLRVARAFLFATSGYRQKAEDIVEDAIFPEAGLEGGLGSGGGSGGMVAVRNIDVFSLCQACLLPFKVCCHVAYVPDDQRVIGLSKLSRVAEMFARRLQTPHRLAKEISEALADTIKPLGVAVVLQCWHPQLPEFSDHDISSNVNANQHMHWRQFSACAGNGQFENSRSNAWREFLGILLLDGIVINDLETVLRDKVGKDSWCPCLLDGEYALPGSVPDTKALPVLAETVRNGCMAGTHSHNSKFTPREAESRVNVMIAAVESILIAISEDLEKQEVRLTSQRFVYWLLHFDRAQDIYIHSDNFEAYGSIVGVRGRSPRPSLNEELEISLIGVEEARNGFLLVFTIPFFSQCEHHLLPFYGVAYIGYFATKTESPDLNRSTLQRIVQAFSRRLQVQERLTKQIAETIVSCYGIQSVMVVLEASHICMISRGVQKFGSNTATVCVTGRFATDMSAKLSCLKKIATRDWT